MTRAVFWCALFCWAQLAAGASEPPYLGEWSNGRGETLTITEETIQFADERPVKYRDITRASDGASFELQITAPGEINAFPGKTLAVVLEDDSMRVTSYVSHADYMQERDAQSVVTWFKDEEN
ncbi:MAG: hypothetical protein ABIR71_14655 [Chthoniobacterales bacterium]